MILDKSLKEENVMATQQELLQEDQPWYLKIRAKVSKDREEMADIILNPNTPTESRSLVLERIQIFDVPRPG
jgi:hypothetical protein